MEWNKRDVLADWWQDPGNHRKESLSLDSYLRSRPLLPLPALLLPSPQIIYQIPSRKQTLGKDSTHKVFIGHHVVSFPKSIQHTNMVIQSQSQQHPTRWCPNFLLDPYIPLHASASSTACSKSGSYCCPSPMKGPVSVSSPMSSQPDRPQCVALGAIMHNTALHITPGTYGHVQTHTDVYRHVRARLHVPPQPALILSDRDAL